MENHKDILKTLQTVLSTELLAPSISSLAYNLGYSSRNIFYRIKKGNANATAIDGFLNRLRTHLNIGTADLQRMESAIYNVSDFNRLIKTEFKQDYPEWQYQAILAFIIHDYSIFSPGFQNGDLRQILLFERSDPRAFFNMLALFYVKSLKPRFYVKNKNYRERCAAIIEPLGDKLNEIFPGNGLGISYAYAYSLSDVNNAESQTLWSLVESMATMLQAFASPIAATEKGCRYRLIPGISQRSYWQGSNPDNVLLLWIRPCREQATGHYELFSISRQSKVIECIASIFILSEKIASVFTKHNSNTQIAVYSLCNDVLSFEWEKSDADPMQTGNSWKRIFLSSSQSLRELDRSLTDDLLTREMAHSEGFEYDISKQPAEVILSRHKLTLILNDGNRYAIDIEFAPFLLNTHPLEPLIVCKQISEDREFAIWPEIRQSIPLDLFTHL